MKVAIAGFGVEGQASLKYWLDKGDEVTVHDEDRRAAVPEGVESILGAGAFDNLSDYDFVVRTASLTPSRLKMAQKVWSATNEFFEKCPATIIGVTGTKGKGTTASLIASILRAAGKTVHLLGNIGVPALEVLPSVQPDDIVVYELSSFQLWDLKKSPHVAVVLMVEPDHLNVHTSFDEYVTAKTNICRYQTADDVCVYHPTNPYSKQIAEAARSGFAMRYGIPEDGAVYVKENKFFVQDHPICSVDTLRLVGQHNVENACAAITAARVFTEDDEAVKKGLSEFTGLPHRLKFVGEANGVKYYDDSISTTPGSAMAALRSFNEPKTIILGGSDKGASYEEVIALCKELNAQIVAVGETGSVIHELASKQDVKVFRIEGLMDEVVQKAAAVSEPGSVVLLSPASASFDQYANYAARGEAFVAAVNALN